MSVVDLVALFLLCLFSYSGYVKGFMKVFMGVFALVGSVIVASLCAGSVASFIVNRFNINTALEVFVEAHLVNNINPNAYGLDFNVQLINGVVSLFDGVAVLGGFLKRVVLSNKEIMGLVGKANEYTISAVVEETVKTIMPSIVFVIHAAVFVSLAVVIYAVLLVFVAYFNRFFNKIPVVGIVNKALGGVLGAVKGLAVVVFLAYAICLVLLISNTGVLYNDVFQNSFVFGLFTGLNKLI